MTWWRRGASLAALAAIGGAGLAGWGPAAHGAPPASRPGPAPRRIVNAWLPSWNLSAGLAAVTANGDLAGRVSPFWYQASGATAISSTAGSGAAGVVSALHQRGILVTPTVSESLDAAGMAALLSDPAQRSAHAAALAQLVAANGFDGLDLDYESMNFGGTAAEKAAVRTGFVALLGELATTLHARGATLSVAVGAHTRSDDPNWVVYDYPAIGAVVDRFRIMTYEYHNRTGSPGAIAPLPWVTRVLAYAVTAVPAAKIEVGVPLYGYDWPVDAAAPDGYGPATTLPTYEKAEALRLATGSPRGWSATDAAPTFSYVKDGVGHVVWYDDAASTRAKMTLVGRYGLAGLTFWYPGGEDTAQWAALRDYATQRPAALTIAAPAAVGDGTALTVTGTLTTGRRVPVAAQPVILQRQIAGTKTWRDIGTAVSTSTGAVSFRVTPHENGAYRLSLAESWSYHAVLSPAARVLVHWKVSAGLSRTRVRHGAKVTISGTLAPARRGSTVRIQRAVGRRWILVGTAKAAVDGTYALTFTAPAAGVVSYRADVPATPANAAGDSAPVRLTVS